MGKEATDKCIGGVWLSRRLQIIELLVRADLLAVVSRELHHAMWLAAFEGDAVSIQTGLTTAIAEARRHPKLAWQQDEGTQGTPRKTGPKVNEVKEEPLETRSPQEGGGAASTASPVPPDAKVPMVSIGQIRLDLTDQMGVAEALAKAFML